MRDSIVILGDTHFSGKKPPCRKDDIISVQFEKFTEVIEISNEFDSPIFHVGDVVDSPNISYSIYSAISELINYCKNGIYSVMGSHDLYWHNMKTLFSTATGALLKSNPKIHMIDEWNKENPNNKFDYINWDEDLIETGSSFLITHKPVIPEKMVKSFFWLRKNPHTHFVLESFKNKYNLILCGHWHRRYIIETPKTLLINPGAMTRREYNDDNLKTFPSVVLLNLKNLSYEVIPLEIAKPNEEVMSGRHMIQTKINDRVQTNVIKFLKSIKMGQKIGSNFLNNLKSTIESGSFDPRTVRLFNNIAKSALGEEMHYEDSIIKNKVKLKVRNNG